MSDNYLGLIGMNRFVMIIFGGAGNLTKRKLVPAPPFG